MYRSVVVVAVVYLSSYLFISLSVYLSIYLSFYLSIYPSLYLSARLPQFLNLTTSSTQQFCETFFELGNVKNEAFLRDFLHFRFWQHQKRSSSARLPSKSKVSAELTASYQCVLRFFHSLSKVLRLPRKSEARSYEVPHLSRKIILANLKI